MRTFYFVGGPTPGNTDAFFRRLAEAGGPLPGWRIWPHADGGGRALHVVPAETVADIEAHLARFADLYEATPPVEIVERGSAPR